MKIIVVFNALLKAYFATFVFAIFLALISVCFSVSNKWKNKGNKRAY